MQYAELDDNGYIVSTYDSPQPDKETVEIPDEAEANNPTKHEKAWHYNGGNPELRDTGNNIFPDPTTAYDKINNYFINKEGSIDAGLDRVDSLMSNYPTADRAISNEAYDIAKNRIDKAKNDGEITSTEASDLKDILDGKT